MNESILSKIKKCLALSKSDNEHEAAQALKHAHALMRKHNIDATDIERSSINETKIKLAKSDPVTWHSWIISSIEKAFNVVATFEYKVECGMFTRHLCFAGHHQNAEIAKYAYDVLFKQINRNRTEYIKVNLKRVKLKANKTRRANAYAEGIAIMIYRTILKFVTEQDQAERSAIYNVLFPPAVVEASEVAEVKTKKKAKVIKHLDCSKDNEAGQRAGENINLFRPVSGSQQELKGVGYEN